MQINAKYMQKLLLQVSYSRSLATSCHRSLLQGPYNHVNGERTVPVDDMGTTTVMEPALGEPLCIVPISGEQEVSRAVKAAKEVFSRWSRTPAKTRGRLLRGVGQKIRDNLEDIARLEVRDTGKPIWEARVDIESCADSFDYFGGVISSYSGQHIPVAKSSFAMVCREPLGVIAGVGAWNFPMQTCTWKVAPALACGNTMVYKPSQLTPLTAVILSELLTEVGVPPGTLNIVQGNGKTGHLLCQHPDVSKISFTGSVPTGSAIMKTASDGLKKITLELGGKSPLIIFDDADVVNAVKATLLANFLTQGEVCSNGTRVLVHENIVTEFLARLLDATIQLKVGNPFDEDTTVGATISAEHAEKVLCYIQEAKGEGATLAYGGERVILPPPLEKGYYLSPCILVNCHDNMRVVQEEVFGAVVSILTFSTEDEVVQRANNSPFGLAGGVFTRNLQRAFHVAQNIEAGTVWVNNYNIYPPELPFGGYKKSGMGRENGTAVLDYYTQQKTVFVELGDVDCGPLYSN